MSAQRSVSAKQAFSLLELLVTIAIIAVLAALLAPSLSKSFAKAKQIHCVSKLRQVGLGLHSFAQDHAGSFPWQIPTLKGGSMYETRFQLKASPLLSYNGRHFEVLSNELVTPKILVCPADKKEAADTFVKLKITNLSYWVFYRASLNDPMHPLAGDLNVQSVGTNRSRLPGRTNLLSIRFDQTVHQFKGNILFADGHVEGIKNGDLPDVAPANPTTGLTSGNSATLEATPPMNPQAGSTPNPPWNSSGTSESPQDSTRGITSSENIRPAQISSIAPRVDSNPESPPPLNDLKPLQPSTNSVSDSLQAGLTLQSSSQQKPSPAHPPGPSAPSSLSGSSPGPFGTSEGVKTTPESDELSSFWPPNLRELQDGIKFAFLLCLILTILGFLWFYFHRRRKEKPTTPRPAAPSFPHDL